ncbi:LuxR family transcriptional regulator [Pseudomonas sp. Irchel 3E20]|uniref:LuxR family transcriptional regulator n=1 Tax=Pseudomonas sp. Irchel 3E20 TaxID=2008983 RepID=UPI000BA2F7AA|nr:LuxR family transcriptional regulator [Pseudomonas sp. Irchel 3E20]
MVIWKEAQLRRLTQGNDIQTTFDIALNLTQEMGFEYCAFAISPHSPEHHQHNLRINNYPNEWNKKYETSNYQNSDPIVRHCSHSVLPIVWTDQAFIDSPHLWREAQSFGLCHGWSQSLHDFRGFFSMLSLARSQQPITPGELYEKAGQLIWLCHALHSVIAQKLVMEGRFRPESKLSLREAEVLKWAAAGKTAADIATILSLSERTVNFHMCSAVKKMGASNKMSAVVKAVKEGIF